MKKYFILPLLCLSAHAAVSVYSTTPTNIVPRGAYPTCTIQVVGTDNKSVTFTTTGGTLVGTNPSLATEPATIALTSSSAAGPFTVTGTSVADPTKTATCVITFTASPTAATTWPRLGGINASNLTALQTKATLANPNLANGIYANGIQGYTGMQNMWDLSCNGGTGNPKQYTVTNSIEYNQTFTITNVVENSSSVVTLTFSSTPGFSSTGLPFSFSGLTTALWLNGQGATITSSTGATITFTDPTGHGTLASTPDTGSAAVNQVQLTVTPDPTGAANWPINLNGMTHATWLNGQPIIISSTTTTLIKFTDPTNHGNSATSADAGLAQIDASEAFYLGPINISAYMYDWAQLANVRPTDPTYPWGCMANDTNRYYHHFWQDPLSSLFSAYTLSTRQSGDTNYGLVGNQGNDNSQGYALVDDLVRGAGLNAKGTGATMSATLTGSTMNLPTITAAGSGYTASNIIYWYAFDATGSTGCDVTGYYGNTSPYPTQTNGTNLVAMGVVQTNGSGGVAGTVTTLVNAKNCTSPPTITVMSDWQVSHDYMAMVGAQMVSGMTTQTPPFALTGTKGPVTGYNSSTQFAPGFNPGYDFIGQRAMGNNYTESRLLYLAAAGLTFNNNPTDDPPLTNTCSAVAGQVCSDGTAYNLFAYFQYLAGSMMYKEWAHLEDPNVSWQAYQAAYSNLPTQPMCTDSTTPATTPTTVPCFGDGRDGEATEGNWYQEAMSPMSLAMVSLVSAGVDDPLIYGPQMSLPFSSWWDMKYQYDLESLSYIYGTGSTVFAYPSTGHTLNLFRQPSDFTVNAWLMVLDSLTGRTDRTNQLLWPLIYSSIGGSANFYSNWQNANANLNPNPMFIALNTTDPTISPPADPRTAFPLDTFSFNNQHIRVASLWDSGGGPTSPSYGGSGSTQQRLDVFSPNTRINHEVRSSGSFAVQSNAEYITLGATTFNNYFDMMHAASNDNVTGWGNNQNQTACTQTSGQVFMSPGCQGMMGWLGGNPYFMTYNLGAQVFNGSSYYQCNVSLCAAADVPGVSPNWTTITYTTDAYGGGQIWQQLQAGNAFMNHAELPTYVAYDIDQIPLYNGSQLSSQPLAGITSVTAASRSFIYLRGSKQVVYYDRGAGASRSRNYLNTTGAITISGNTASWPTQSATQKAYYTNLLPAGITLFDMGGFLTNANGSPGTSDWERVSTILEDAGSPSSTQFLNVLEWGASGFSKSTTTLVQSSAGNGLDCALIGTTMACFQRTWPGTLTGSTYPASGATTHYVSDLTPNTSYTITGAGTPSSAVSDNAGVLTFAATGTGNIVVGAAAPPATPTQYRGNTVIRGHVSPH